MAMFENVPTPPNQVPQQPVTPPAPKPPYTPPMGTPPTGPSEPEDIFARVNTGGGTPVPPSGPAMMAKAPSNLPKILLVAGLSLVVVALLVVGGYYLYASLKKPAAPVNQPVVNENVNVVNENLNTNAANENLNTNAVNENLNTNAANDNLNANTNTSVNAALDSDADGLSDAEEARLGTNPNSLDTDGDGLFDGEEVLVYHTDPLNPDTDGDGYKDGEEVANGYNPNGPGKLLQVPQTNSNTNGTSNTNL